MRNKENIVTEQRKDGSTVELSSIEKLALRNYRILTYLTQQ